MATYKLDIFSGDNDVNLGELKWRCPKCRHKHAGIGDVFEWLKGGDGDDVDVVCDRCEAKFVLTVNGDYDFTPNEMLLSEVDSPKPLPPPAP